MDFINEFSVDMENFPYFNFVVGTIVINFIFETFVDLRQRSQLKKTKMPPQLKMINITEEKFKESNAYGLEKMNFGLIKGFYGLTKELLFLHFLLYPYLWKLCVPILEAMGRDTTYKYTHQIIYLVLESTLSTIIGIPWGLYGDFVLEEKWGFNKKTIGLFFTDLVKYYLLNMCLMPPIILIILWLVDYFGEQWYVIVWAFMTCVMFVMMWIFPNFIQPCFNKVEELPEGETRTDIEVLAKRIKFPLKQLYQIDGSKRSGHSNAYMYGFCGNKRIVLFDTLLEQMERQEIVAVLGHELGHWYFSHTLKRLVYMELQMFFMLFGIGYFINDINMYKQFGFDDKNFYIGVSIAGQLFSALDPLIKFFINGWTRSMEFQADKFACDLNYGKDLRSGLLKLSEENKSTYDPDYLYSTYNYSHPPVLERISIIDENIKNHQKKSS